jgi:dihydroorotate dehydrogenase
VNCMGLNGPGRVVAAQNLAARKARGELPKCPIILNSCNGLASQIEDDKVEEHVANFETFFDLVDIFEVNISCPNQKDAQAMGTNIPLLVNTLTALQRKNEQLARDGKKKKPIWLKIKPDYFQEGGAINTDALKLILQATHGLVDGYTLTNTTTDRSSLKQHGYEDPGKGWLSGAPLLAKQLVVTKTVRDLLDDMDGDKVLISTGGIGTGHTASEIIETGRMAVEAGADLAGIYTGLMINGVAVPSLVSAGMQEESRKYMPVEL